jgi:hypothetical protein
MFDSLRVRATYDAHTRHTQHARRPAHAVHRSLTDGPCAAALAQKLKRISCHVLVAHGQNDNLVPKTHPKKMVRKLENLWKRLELEGVGHHDVEASHDCLDALVEFVEFLMPNGTSIKSEIVVPSTRLLPHCPQPLLPTLLLCPPVTHNLRLCALRRTLH